MAGCEEQSTTQGDAAGPETFKFFWRNDSPFSQWYISVFKVDGVTFNCAEQYMMYKKAVIFQDQQAADAIMKTKKPREQKKLGRGVMNYDDDKWNSVCLDVVKTGNRHKFLQNPKLLEELLATAPSTLVEASPLDCKWGIGLAEEDPLAQSRENWRGENLLGQALTEVRDEILAEQRKGS